MSYLSTAARFQKSTVPLGFLHGFCDFLHDWEVNFILNPHTKQNYHYLITNVVSMNTVYTYVQVAAK